MKIVNNLSKKVIVILCFSLLILAQWSCESNGNASPDTGQAGSMARFAVSGDKLYIVEPSMLQVYDIADPLNPIVGEKIHVGVNMETVFIKGNSLFIGSQNGMHIYDISIPSQPTFLSVYDHITSCDPVVVQGNYAYVTLRSGADCRFGQNLLDVVDVSNLKQPKLVSTKSMLNPHGLAVKDSILIVCEGEHGFKLLNVIDPQEVQAISHIENLSAYDVIIKDSIAIVTGKDGIFQYDFSDPENIELLSQITP